MHHVAAQVIATGHGPVIEAIEAVENAERTLVMPTSRRCGRLVVDLHTVTAV
jgi:hypothetical protein